MARRRGGASRGKRVAAGPEPSVAQEEPRRGAVPRRIEALWRIEGPRIVAALARVTGDVGFAEDMAQEAVAEALAQWPAAGVPRNPAAWLTAVAKRRAIDSWRRTERLEERYRRLAQEAQEDVVADWNPVPDDVLRLVFSACHPELSLLAQITLTLRVVGGLSTREIARLFVVPVATVQQRIVRAKKTLAAAKVPFEVPEPSEWEPRLAGALRVIYLMFTEGYSATSGDQWIRQDLAGEALRLGRVLARLVPREPEAHALVALMEFQTARFAARTRVDGTPILLAEQDRSSWDRGGIERGREALARADALGRGRGNYALQAAVAKCHCVAANVDGTDWPQIVLLYEALGRLAPGPVVELNRAVAVSMATGPETALAIADRLVAQGVLRGSHLLPSVRGELLSRLGRSAEARAEFTAAAALAGNTRERDMLLRRAAE
ncbi:RNA polymerase sigma factor [Arthrobacter gengyunqii]|uniref:RNA polymerase sigma factor n=1 Tax=Arthrobacter gengyunqii TaxID=2886940 RepID=A0A9X1M148_9MICC|nr:RNA polymerase sigma factor [Arthrobacter gengyunqii]MCC3269388.1 RNA polymerase sigma factor [Arthrobacter gengyunqii]UOY94666.1 RNA polymerase sigma factor [Arthrobacter gengyunqii]